MKLIAVINTIESIEEVLEENFPGCSIDFYRDEVEIKGIAYTYNQVEVVNNPNIEVSLYILEKI